MIIQDVCTEALSIVLVDQNDTPSSTDLATALSCLIGACDTWSADTAKIYTSVITTKTLVSGRQIYTIGQDASMDFNIPRPPDINFANIIDMSQPTYPVRYPLHSMDDAEWSNVRLQNVPTPIPTAFYYDKEYTRIGSTLKGQANIFLFGIPSNSSNKLEIYTEQSLSQFSALSDAFIVPVGYYEAILYGTARRLYPRFGIAPSQTVLQLEQDALKSLELRNLSTPILKLDSGLPNAAPAYFDARTNRFL